MDRHATPPPDEGPRRDTHPPAPPEALFHAPLGLRLLAAGGGTALAWLLVRLSRKGRPPDRGERGRREP